MTAQRITAGLLIQQLNLSPHPEGGWFRETYRAAETITADALPERFGGARAFSTAIYYLLHGCEFSGFHRIQSDELWHFYAGTAIRLHVLENASDPSREIRLGLDVAVGERPQCVIPAGTMFAAELVDRKKSCFGLVGCTVAPGFDFADFELADRALLLQHYPQHSGLIERLTHEAHQP